MRSVMWVLLLAACGQSPATPSDAGSGTGTSDAGGNAGTTFPAPVYEPAPRGTATGTPVTQTIDANGGSVMSADGRLTLTVAAGTLSAPTAITIQPITATSPNGAGLGYRLSPDGMTFATPVTLTFHLSPTQAIALDSTFVVSQHADGTWWSQPHQTRDAAAQTLSVPAKHFSDWAVAQTVQLSPPSARVRTTGSASYNASVLAISPDDDELANPNGESEVQVPAKQQLTDQIGGTHIWAVNSISGGNATVGKVSNSAPGSTTFEAPATPPNPTKVTVSLTVTLGKSQVIAPAEADIYGQEIWSGYSDVTTADGTKVHAEFVFEQDLKRSDTSIEYFAIKSGTVTIKPLSPTAGGCTLAVVPDSYQMSPMDGSMIATYNLADGPDSPNLQGVGSTEWVATYNVTCPNGPSAYMYPVAAPWWPAPLGGPPPMLLASEGVLDAPVSNPGASGTIHLERQ